MVAESNIEASAEQALHNGFSPLHVENSFLPTMLQVSALWVQLIRALLSTWYMSTLSWKHEMHGLSLSRPLIHVQQAINLVTTHFAKNGHLCPVTGDSPMPGDSVITQRTSVRTKKQSEHSPWLQPCLLTIFKLTFSTYHVFLKRLPKIPINKPSCWRPVWSDKK